MSGTANYDTVGNVVVQFNQHPAKPDAHAHLNGIYTTLLDPDVLFSTPRTTVRDDAHLAPAMRAEIAKQIYKLASTKDIAHINDALTNCALSVSNESSTRKSRLTSELLTKVLDGCVGNEIGRAHV